jgi:uncharacterized membrane-anchored protein YitT (DUF2179 family)
VKKLRQHPKFASIVRGVYDYTLIFVGSVILAANVPLFLEPNHVVATGATGIGVLAYYLCVKSPVTSRWR